MPYMLNKRLSKMTDHEDLGMNNKGKRQFKCKETGDIRGYSKSKINQIKASREKSKEIETKEDIEYSSHGVSNDNVNQLREFLDSGLKNNNTPNVTETRAN